MNKAIALILCLAVGTIFGSHLLGQDQNQKKKDLVSRYHDQVVSLHSDMLREQTFIQTEIGRVPNNVNWESVKSRLEKTEHLAARYALAVRGLILEEELRRTLSEDALDNLISFLDITAEDYGQFPEWKRLFNNTKAVAGDQKIQTHADLALWWVSDKTGQLEKNSDGEPRWVNK